DLDRPRLVRWPPLSTPAAPSLTAAPGPAAASEPAFRTGPDCRAGPGCRSGPPAAPDPVAAPVVRRPARIDQADGEVLACGVPLRRCRRSGTPRASSRP